MTIGIERQSKVAQPMQRIFPLKKKELVGDAKGTVRAWNKIGKGGCVAENKLRLIKLLPFQLSRPRTT